MNESELRNLLTQLHDRLGNSRSLDADDRRLLVTVLARYRKSARKQPGRALIAQPRVSNPLP